MRILSSKVGLLARGVTPWVATAVVLMAGLAHADDEVPPALQARLLAKATDYIRNLPVRAKGPTKVLVVFVGDTDSLSREAQTITGKLRLEGFLPVPLAFRNTAELKAKLATEKPTVVYLTNELDETSVRATLEAHRRGQF